MPQSLSLGSLWLQTRPLHYAERSLVTKKRDVLGDFYFVKAKVGEQNFNKDVKMSRKRVL